VKTFIPSRHSSYGNVSEEPAKDNPDVVDYVLLGFFTAMGVGAGLILLTPIILSIPLTHRGIPAGTTRSATS
jgi:hypothetical protein